MWIEPATVPPRKPSFCAVASSWMLPRWLIARLRGRRCGPTSTPLFSMISVVVVSVVMMRASCVWDAIIAWAVNRG